MHMNGRTMIAVIVAGLATIALGSSRTAGADRYRIIDLGSLPGMPHSAVWQQTINNGGAVVAYANPVADDIASTAFFGDSAFIWKNGTSAPLPGLPGAIDTVPFSLNDEGQVVGRSTPLGGRNVAVVWDHEVVYALGQLPGDNSSAALQINNHGQAVGYSRKRPLRNGIDRRAVIWSRGTITQLPSLAPSGGPALDEALGINDHGQIVGFSGTVPGLEHIALWDKHGVHDLGTLGGDWGEAVAINDSGQISGLSLTASGDLEPFLWTNGVLTDLGVLAGDVGGAAEGMNNHGQVVGISGTSLVNGETTDIYKSHAVLWEHGAIINLQTQIPAGSGWTLTVAAGINDRGQIAAQGVHNGILRAVLLTPTHDG